MFGLQINSPLYPIFNFFSTNKRNGSSLASFKYCKRTVPVNACLGHENAAVTVDDLTGYIGGFVAGQEEAEVGYFIRASGSAQGGD